MVPESISMAVRPEVFPWNRKSPLLVEPSMTAAKSAFVTMPSSHSLSVVCWEPGVFPAENFSTMANVFSFWAVLSICVMMRFGAFFVSFASCLWLGAEEFVGQVCPPDAAEFGFDFRPFFRFIPEKEHPLCQFLLRRVCAVYGFQCVRMNARGPGFGADGHGSRREVLHLLQMEVQRVCHYGQFGHVFFRAARVATDEIGDDLLVQPGLAVDAFEYVFERFKLVERRFAHQA